ncbi:MAG: nucleotidyltransferase family protein [Cyclobacteriaceae bacterium]|nr:nucleotidyltransferase family protein [Cyclobacteriaceae bacterium]
MNSSEIISKLRVIKQELKETYSIESMAVFGSYAKNSATTDSDVDILVTFKKPIGWSFFDLKEELEIRLGKKIDLVTPNALKSLIKDAILKEAIDI